MFKKFLAIVLTMFYCQPSWAAYSYSRSIAVCNNSTCPANQTNYTVLICANGTMGNGNSCATVAGLNQSGGGAHVQNSNGYDINFFTNSNCTGSLNWEMEKYVASTGEIEAWILIPSLSSSGQTIYMCYGDPTISSFQGGAIGTAWDTNLKVIYHTANGSVLSASDSTSNGNNGTLKNTPAAGTGQMDGGMVTVGSSRQGIETPSINIGTSFTVSAWANHNSVALANYNRILENSYSNGFYLGTNGTSHQFAFIVSGNFGLNAGVQVNGSWQLVTGVYDGTNAYLYLNGALAGGPVAMSNPSIGSHIIGFGYSETGNAGEFWDGSLDEARIATTNRSANWIATEYNSQSNPSNFESFGNENSIGGSSVFSKRKKLKLLDVL